MKDIYNPDYYRTGKIEVADYIEDKGFNFFLGNVVKYVSRAGKKEGNALIQDLKKAKWYLDREISRQEQLLKIPKKTTAINGNDVTGTWLGETYTSSEEVETDYPYNEEDFEFVEGADYDDNDDEEGDEPLG